MSVEQPLWHALRAYRLLTLCYALSLHVLAYDRYDLPVLAGLYMAVLTAWTLATSRRVRSAETCTVRFLAGDLTVALAGILLTRAVETAESIGQGVSTLPSVWSAGAVLGCALKGGWRWGAVSGLLVGAGNVLERGGLAGTTVHNVLLVCVASIAIGYVIEVARASERTLARALEIEAATRERERLARDIHDGVLQVLAMVQRRGVALGGEAAELGRMAGEQEVALRALVTTKATVTHATTTKSATVTGATGHPASPTDPDGPDGPGGTSGAYDPGPGPGRQGGVGAEHADPPERHCDLAELLAARAGARVTFAGPGSPVRLARSAAGELAAAVGAALDNVRRHAGEDSRAWILLEDEPDAVLVSVRDDGPGIPAGRLEHAEAEGRMGVALSIRGRLRELGGTAEVVSVPGQGTEVELRVPKHV
ncbi:histidine kinase [Streptomyces oceani]|uniref:Histidine kinase n=2 Tax=Streptomyces oceani TaxID=1075402 RepID=A0A1E7KCR6_9ACTN|nr:histidine kinase [Streptomyces oceani]